MEVLRGAINGIDTVNEGSLVSGSEPRGGSESLLEEIRNHVSNMELSEPIWKT